MINYGAYQLIKIKINFLLEVMINYYINGIWKRKNQLIRKKCNRLLHA
jgi:hypothetical protein